jgi:hypothetical protein
MKTIVNTININQVRLVKILALIFVTLIVTYLYCVNYTAFSAAAYERLSQNISDIQSEIGELELAYIDNNRGIGKEMGDDMGLIAVNEVDTIFAKSSSQTKLTFNE